MNPAHFFYFKMKYKICEDAKKIMGNLYSCLRERYCKYQTKMSTAQTHCGKLLRDLGPISELEFGVGACDAETAKRLRRDGFTKRG